MDERRQGPLGLGWGIASGVLLWAIYFLQASLPNGLFWTATVVPAVGIVAGASFAVAALYVERRGWWIGFGLGVATMLPVALFCFMVLFAVAGLE